jgi:hypothetical protein
VGVVSVFDTASRRSEDRGVLHEIKDVRQERGAGRRRWFESEGMDLVVWLDSRDAVAGFQICYDLGQGEHALTWRPGGGFAHHAVDQGDTTPLKNEAPMLVPDGSVPWASVTRMFNQRSAELEAPLRDLVHAKLAEQEAAGAR